MLPDNQQTAIRIENGSVEQQISEVLQEVIIYNLVFFSVRSLIDVFS